VKREHVRRSRISHRRFALAAWKASPRHAVSPKY
jgi:hypothetical protein